MGGRCQSRDEWKVLCLRERGRECSRIFFLKDTFTLLEKSYISFVKKQLLVLDDFLDQEKFSILGKISVKNLHHHCQLVQFSLCKTKKCNIMMILTLLSPHAGTNREENPSRIHEIGVGTSQRQQGVISELTQTSNSLFIGTHLFWGRGVAFSAANPAFEGHSALLQQSHGMLIVLQMSSFNIFTDTKETQLLQT